MIYLNNFKLRSADSEQNFFMRFYRTCYDSYYPFQFFPRQKKLSEVEFSDVTIFCGSNGSGKSTLLNIIAESLKLNRDSPYNKTDFFDPYIEGCQYELNVHDKGKMRDLMKVSRIITSDDVFKHIIGVRERNENLSFKRELIFDEKRDIKMNGWQGPRGFNADDPESINAYRDYHAKFRQPASKYVRRNVGVDERTYSNGENGFKYFTDAIQPGGLYLLDEPENSLSAEMQLELVQYIQGMARFYDCQFIMSSHSPFILSIPFARIYNMDEVPVVTCAWTELPNVRIYYDFFNDHSNEFKQSNEEVTESSYRMNGNTNEKEDSEETKLENILQKDMNTLREGFICYCRLLGVRQDTCLSLTLMLSSKEALIMMMQFMAKLDEEGIQKEKDKDDITTMVVRKAEKVRNWQDKQDPQLLHFS